MKNMVIDDRLLYFGSLFISLSEPSLRKIVRRAGFSYQFKKLCISNVLDIISI